MSGGSNKFINAFKSIQMIGDYEQTNDSTISESSKDKTNEAHSFSEIQFPEKNDTKNESENYNGDDLYNPLEVEDSSDEDTTDKNEATDIEKEPERIQNISPISSPDSVTNENNSSMLSETINEAEFSLEKSPKKSVKDGLLDDDELLGTALAELEEEEKQMEQEKNETDGKKKKKKKDKEKDDKKKKKKKKKKKAKDKNKDKPDKEERKEKKRDEKKSNKSFTETKDTSLKDKSSKDTPSKDTPSKDKDRHRDKEKKVKKDKKKDKKEREGSHDRDRDRKSSRNRHSSSKDVITSDKHASRKEKEKHSDNHSHRKRSHRSRSPDRNSSSKRSRNSDVHDRKSDIHDRKSDAHDSKSDVLDRKSDAHDRKSDAHDRKSEFRDHKHRQSSKSPSSRDHSKRERRYSLNNKSRNENELTSPRHEKKSEKQHSSEFLTNEEFIEIQKEAKKMQRQASSGSSSVEQQRLVIEDFDNGVTHKDNTRHNDSKHSPKSRSKSPRSSSSNNKNNNTKIVVEKSPEIKHTSKNNQNEGDVDFIMAVNDTAMYDDIVVSSQSDNDESVSIVDAKKSSKPGALSIHEYKKRRKGGGDSRLSSSSQSEEEVRFISDGPTNLEKSHRHSNNNDKNEREEAHKEMNGSSLYDVTNFDNESEKEDDKSAIPMLSESKENIKPQSTGEESPYNPETSPINFESPRLSPDIHSDDGGRASPSQAAVDDSVDILAYKDVVAFQDIMKSKVKHEAKKHKRKKLEEMRQELESKDPSCKERRLVDYLIRQAQVEEMMKNNLKSYFKSREITKDEYKYILKKAVPQVTMSGSSIVPEKIESLMVKFVRKCKGLRAKEAKDEKRKKQRAEIEEQQKELQQQIQSNAAMLTTLGGFEMKALNPNLPLPPM